MFTVQLVDDEPIVRVGLRKLINWKELGFEVICESSNGEEALQQLESNHIDVIITDIDMPIMDGMTFMSHVRKKECSPEILILTAYGEFNYAKEAIKYGVLEYILKPIDEEEIVKVLKGIKKKLENKPKYTLSTDVSEKKRAFSREKDKLLIKYMLSTDQEFFEVLENIAEEEYAYGEKITMNMRFSYILEEIVAEINKKFSYLSKLEVMEYYLDFSELENLSKENLINKFKEKIIRLFRMFEESRVTHKDNIIMQACQYVIENIDDEINLTTISDRLTISKNYFCRLFKQETGENFLNFVTRMKMKRAQLLLKEENLKVYEVCYMLGYMDTTYFTRLFKKYIHMTPSEYKKVVYDQYE